MRERGFSLVELVLVIVVLGIVGVTVAVFMRAPIDAYADAGRRAALSDLADTAVRRIGRDLARALPNSVRGVGSQCVEFIPTRTGGRYRAQPTGAGGNQDAAVLDFDVADTAFHMLGNVASLPADQQIQPGDQIVIYNLGIPGSDAYAGDNVATVATVTPGTETAITIAARQFPFASPSSRFQVIPGNERIVSFACNGGRLLRSANHAYANSCPTTGPTVAVLADRVAACQFEYAGSDLQRNGLVRLSITLTDAAGETLSLYHEVHVGNTP